jgi:3-phosphoshikimate 1-carboxyvinyltransferase
VNRHHIHPVTQLRGTVKVPGDKSASHRALMISALASGPNTIRGLSSGLDVASTRRIITQLGASVDDDAGRVVVTGPDEGLVASAQSLDCGNSGTTMRLLAGIVSTVAGRHVLVGDESLSTRPMDRVARPLEMMGASVRGHGPRVTAPLTIVGSTGLRGLDYRVPMASAQVKSAVLFAGLGADSVTVIEEDVRTRTTTEDMLALAGVSLESTNLGDGRVVVLTPGRPEAREWLVPGDPSQAAFFAVLGALHADAQISVVDIDASPERIGFVDVLQRMGVDIDVVADGSTATLTIRSSTLLATEIRAEEIPSVDEVPILAVAAAGASGVSAFRDMGELRLKESDRFAGSMRLAAALGCTVWSEDDDFFIEGLSSAESFGTFTLDAGLDHRMVMAGAVAGLVGSGCSIAGADSVLTSYPRFFDDVAALS